MIKPKNYLYFIFFPSGKKIQYVIYLELVKFRNGMGLQSVTHHQLSGGLICLQYVGYVVENTLQL